MSRVSSKIIVPLENAPALAQALSRVLDADAWRVAPTRHARRRVEAGFVLEAVGKQLRPFLFPI